MGSVTNLIPWQKGQSGNPAGRPKGSRNKLEEAFLADLLASWESRGGEAIEAAIEKDPLGYVKTVASLMPKRVDPETPLEGVTREQLGIAIAALESWIAANGSSQAGSGDGVAGQTVELPAVPQTR